MSAQHTPGPLRLKGHALEHFRTGAQSGYANGRCKCGWRTKGWYAVQGSVRAEYRSHLYTEKRALEKLAAIAKATGSAS